MDKQQLTHLLFLQQASRQGRLVAFVGAGVSKNSNVPMWSELTSAMKNGLNIDDETDDLKIAQLYKNARGHKEFMDKIKEVLKYNKTSPNPLHKRIFSLNPCHIITTNYDDLIEQEKDNEFKQFAVIREDADMPQMTYPNAIVKMHGDFDKDNIVLTEEDYYEYASRFPLIRAFVLSLFASKVVVFMGFSFNDLNLKMILHQLRGILSDKMQRIYMLSCEKPTELISSYFSHKGINVVYVNGQDFEELSCGRYQRPKHLDDSYGERLDQLLWLIQNVQANIGNDLALNLYERLIKYKDEMRAMGRGILRFFPKEVKVHCHLYSDGLQIFSHPFKEIKQLIQQKGIRGLIEKYPSLSIREVARIAYYNNINELDEIKLLGNNALANINKYLPQTPYDMLEYFDFQSVEARLKDLRKEPIEYNLDDLDIPYTLYLIGDYYGAYVRFKELIPLYWEKHRYILYYICLYNIFSIRNAIRHQLSGRKDIDGDYIADSLEEINLEETLDRLQIDNEVRQILQDLISSRAISAVLATTEKLKEEIHQQRKLQERGGWSLNSNISSLLGQFERERKFYVENKLVFDRTGCYQTICNNVVFGILNSYATPESRAEGRIMPSTRITSFDAYLLSIVTFSVSYNTLNNLFKYYDIENLKLDDSAVLYINNCLTNLLTDHAKRYANSSVHQNAFRNLLLVISVIQGSIDADLIFRNICDYWDIFAYDACKVLEKCLNKHKIKAEMAQTLMGKILYSPYRIGREHGMCIGTLSKVISDAGLVFDNLKWEDICNRQIADYIYPLIMAVNDSNREKLISYCLENIQYTKAYINCISRYEATPVDDGRLSNLLANDCEIDDECCFLLSEIYKNEKQAILHSAIEKYAKQRNILQFYLAPDKYAELKDITVEQVLEIKDKDLRMKLFRNSGLHEKLKEYLVHERMSKFAHDFLIQYL